MHALGEYGAKAIRERLALEAVVPAADLGNPGFGTEPPPVPPADPTPSGDVPQSPPKKKWRMRLPGRKQADEPTS